MALVQSLKKLLGVEISIPGPDLDTVTPPTSDQAGGTALVLAGTGFTRTGATVTINGIECTSVVVVSAIEITCETPVFPDTGVYDVVVTNPPGGTNGGLSSTLAGAFTVTP